MTHSHSLHHDSRRDIAPYAPYAYDATKAAALGVVAFANIYNNGVIPQNINGLALKKVLMANISFSGYTGQIAFSQGRPRLSHYGVGDRTAGVRFVVSNFNSGNGSYSVFQLARVGTWTTEGGFALCGSDPTLQSSVTGGCMAIDYGTVGNVRPADRPPTIYMLMSKASKAALYFLAAVTFCVCVFFMSVLIAYRKTRLLKASQPSMTWIIITANLFSVARIVLAGADVTGDLTKRYHVTGSRYHTKRSLSNSVSPPSSSPLPPSFSFSALSPPVCWTFGPPTIVRQYRTTLRLIHSHSVSSAHSSAVN